MPTPASTVLRRLAYKRIAERIARDLEHDRRMGWIPCNVYLCQALAEEADHCVDYYSPDVWWGQEGCGSWTQARKRAYHELQKDWPEFAMFKPKHKQMGAAWFGEDYMIAGANTERRLIVLAFCIAMTEKP